MITKPDSSESLAGSSSKDITATSRVSTAPLGVCLLIDYRLSSRARLKNCIKSMGLFESIHEPGSLHSCLAMIAKDSIDTCVFGPSVRPEKIREFMGKFAETSKPIECAFVIAHSHVADESISGVHSFVKFPCSQSAFNAGVVSALTRAHGGALPEAKRYDRASGKPISLKQSVEKLEFPEDRTVDTVIRENRSSLWPRETFDCVLRNSKLLREKLAEIQPFNLRFRSDGSPTEFTTETVLSIIDSVFPNAETTPGMPKFKVVLEELLYKWAHIGTQLGRRTADTCLKREIINCFGLSIQ